MALYDRITNNIFTYTNNHLSQPMTWIPAVAYELWYCRRLKRCSGSNAAEGNDKDKGRDPILNYSIFTQSHMTPLYRWRLKSSPLMPEWVSLYRNDLGKGQHRYTVCSVPFDHLSDALAYLVSL
jgi:hypothetical protein